MSTQWFVRSGGFVYGPFDSAGIRQLAAEGRITRASELGHSSAGPWQKADKVRGLSLRNDSADAPQAVQQGNPTRIAPPPPPASRHVIPPAVASLGSVAESDFGWPASIGEQSPWTNRKAPPRNKKKRRSQWGLLGAVIGLVVVAYGVSNVALRGYLHTDAAAIALIKKSMQETFEKAPEVSKPVKVVDVELSGTGRDRNGSAVVRFAGEAETLPFTATLTKSGGRLNVSWKLRDIAPLSTVQPGLQSTEATSVVSREKYNAIKEGMSYSQVAAIIGHEGEEQAASSGGIKGYLWMNSDGSGLIVVFEDDKLGSKTALGFLPSSLGQ